MDVLDTLLVRFHYSGEFINDGKRVHYCGGKEAMSGIERDKVSLPEIVGHLRDHCEVYDGTLLHWLFPGKELHDGLRVLVDDKACLNMCNCIVDRGVAEIYVEVAQVHNLSDFEDEQVDMDDHGAGDEDYQSVHSKKLASIKSREDGGWDKSAENASGSKTVDSDDSDSDYMLGDAYSSEEDDEAT